jgi:hypothetical protein
MAEGIADFFEIDSWNTSYYSEASEPRRWDIFEGTDGDLAYLLGLAEDAGLLFLVMVTTTPDLTSEYTVKVFYPAVNAIESAA